MKETKESAQARIHETRAVENDAGDVGGIGGVGIIPEGVMPRTATNRIASPAHLLRIAKPPIRCPGG